MQQRQFLDVVDRDEAERRFRTALGPLAPRREIVSLASARGRVLGEDIVASVDVPGFDRSDVDGFAVRGADTFDAAEEAPRRLVLLEESLPAGRRPMCELAPGHAISIATGAVVPRGADAVVMCEETAAVGSMLLVRRATAPGANITHAGSDIARGETVLRAGQLLTARETGVLAALGLAEVVVIARPKVAIASTGDEIVAPGCALSLGQVYDSNATVLAHMVEELGGVAVPLGIVPDDEAQLEKALRAGLECDAILLSGGTSKGEGDLSYRVVGALGAPGIVVHGVALKPGKPVCLAIIEVARKGESRRVPIAVLPGFPTSAVFTFREFVGPVVRELAGLAARPETVVMAKMPMRINSARGRTEYSLVSLSKRQQDWTAYPLGKGSGSVTTFAHADGFITMGRNIEYLETDAIVEVRMLTPEAAPADLTVVGSHCLVLDRLLGEVSRQGFRVKMLAVGSTGGVLAVRRGEADLAGIHLLDESTGEYNAAFVPPNASLVRGYERMQGVVFRAHDERFKGRRTDEAIAAALADADCRMCNRNRGSGTRILIDRLLGNKRPEGYSIELRSHHAVAAAVRQGRADWGIAIEAVVEASDLGFLPYGPERFDFLIPNDRLDQPVIRAFLAALDQLQSKI